MPPDSDAAPIRADHEAPVHATRHRGLPVPWWAKLGAKVALGALRIPPALQRRVGLNRHSFAAESRGKLLNGPRAAVAAFTARNAAPPTSWLEIGPGRMVARAPLLHALGFRRITYLDLEDDGPRDLAPYRHAAAVARDEGLAPPELEGAATPAEALARAGAELRLGGPERLAEIPAGSVDVVFSEAVLEHVRREALPALLAALARVTAPQGVQWHAIDLRDHLGGARRHLGFPASFWEGPLMARSGVYTNRLGATAWLDAFRAAGLTPRLAWAEYWPDPEGAAHPDTGHAPEDRRFASLGIVATRTAG
ncbi:MAG: methyltransferase domain-containing protein [Rubritepida sp.]|nr:methyltransferase domain-containing protein [Rubritepida sp.]